MSELEKLKLENDLLKKKLKVAENWVQRVIKEEVKKISKRKISKMTSNIKDSFMNENIEEIISKKIHDFFGDFILINTPSSAVDNIISGEINYYNLKQNPNFDGFSVISSYHKALDTIIESIITKGFRKYSKKKKQVHIRVNTPLEKTLNQVVVRGYLLSIGRLFHLVKDIKKGNELYDYGKVFKEYLDKYYYLKEALIEDDNFYKQFEKIINSDILGKKRHSGSISFEETTKARKILIGDFKDENSLIYKLLKTQESEI